MPDQDQQGVDTKTNPILKTSRITAGILFLLLVLGVAFYTKKDFFVPQKVEVPRELILGDKIDSSNVRLDSDQKDFVLYEVDVNPENLVKVYIERLTAEGWTINFNRVMPNKNYIISAQKNGEQADITFFANLSSKTEGGKILTRVGVFYKKQAY